MNAESAQTQESLARIYRRYLAANVLFHQSAADSVGLAAVDYQASNILELDGPLSNGELAQRLGLSTGAATRLVDRLEAHGLAQRTTDPIDRRRTVIAHTGSLPAKLVDTLRTVREPIARAITSLTPDQLDSLLAYLATATTAYLDAARTIAGKPGDG